MQHLGSAEHLASGRRNFSGLQRLPILESFVSCVMRQTNEESPQTVDYAGKPNAERTLVTPLGNLLRMQHTQNS